MLQRPKRLKIANDKCLLRIFLAGAVVVAISIILIPLNIENETLLSHHGVVKLTQDRVGYSVEGKVSSNRIEKRPSQRPAKEEKPTPLEQRQKVEPIATKDDKLGTPKVSYHIVFSTGCSTFQDWQSYVFFFHLLNSGQEGHVTRIASGCEPDDERDLKSIFQSEIASMAPERFHLHLTPEFANVKPGTTFKYFNKPFGMRHWMQHALGYPDKHMEHDESIIILMDPDQILLRPFTNDFTNSSEKWRLKAGRNKWKVEHGSPFSQQYGYGLQWLRKPNPENVFRGENTPILNLTTKDAYDYYTGMGPPYIATAKDMYSIVSKWAEIVPRVHDEYPFLLAEMFGYNLASAHLGLKHTIAHSFMVSDVWAGGEGWKLIHAVESKDVCHNFPQSELPHVIHYCQRYFVGKYFIGKYRLRKDFISCKAPLLNVPPADIAVRYKRAFMPPHPNGGPLEEKNLTRPNLAKSEAFMVCAMIRALNEAAVYYKDHHCDKATANYEYNYTFHEDMTMPEDEK